MPIQQNFGNIQKKIHSTLQLLYQIHQSPSSDLGLALALHLTSQLYELILEEKILWKSKSRETWLTCKDLNTEIFHISTLIRIRRNAVDFMNAPLVHGSLIELPLEAAL